MRNIVAFRVEIQPRAGQTSRECLTAVRDEMAEWVHGLFAERGVHDLQLPFDGRRLEPMRGHVLTAEDRSCDTHRLVRLDWEVSDPEPPAKVWSFYGAAACDARAVEAVLAVRVRAESFALRPLPVLLSAENPLHAVHRLRDKLVLGWDGRLGGQPIPTRSEALRENQVDAFVRRVLLNPKRVLPVVLFSIGGALRMDFEALYGLQSFVLGFAHIAGLLDQPAADRMARLLGPKAYRPDVVMRLYFPGLLQDGLPQAHPVRTAEQLKQDLQKAQLPQILVNTVAPLAAEQLWRGPLIAAAREALHRARAEAPRIDPSAAQRLAAAEAEARQAQQDLQHESQASQRRVAALLDELTDLRTELAALRAKPPAEVQFDDLAPELERAWDENGRLRQHLETTRRQLTELETDFRNYLDASALFGDAGEAVDGVTPAAPAAGRKFANVADALRTAAREFEDILAVWEDAEESAQRSLFPCPEKVFQALAAVADVGRAYFKARGGGPALGPVDRAFLRRVPFKYTGFESPTTLNLFGSERVFRHHGQSRQMQRHLTLGGGTTNNCLQIYFDFDDASRRVLIGYCGRHLPYARQRT